MSDPLADKTERVEHNRRAEQMWREGKITFSAFDWWLRWICGV
jgi:hypothetical protein